MEKKIGIIGVGMVGGALKRYFEKMRNIQPFVYDRGKNIGSPEEVNKADIIFICVPTPFNKEKNYFDLSYIEDAFSNIKGEKIVVIKSTVLPGTAEFLQERYPQHKILNNPEFLTEATADQDMCYPDRQIVGYTKKSFDVAGDILMLLPLAPFSRILPATEAEMVKYFGNTWFSTKVIFANQMYDLCQKLGINYDRVMEAAAADKRIGRTHLEVWHKGKRGYAGKCLIGEEMIYQYTGNGIKIVPIKDFCGDYILSAKDGKLFIDKVLAKSKRKIEKTVKVNLSKGRNLEMSPDHLVVYVDKNGHFNITEAENLKIGDKIPVILDKLPVVFDQYTINLVKDLRIKEGVFVGNVARDYANELKPYLSFHQYKGLKRVRPISLPLSSVIQAKIPMEGLIIKTGKTGTWIPSQMGVDKDFVRLIGYYLAEGCVSDNRVFFSFGYSEKELIEDVKFILGRIGIKFSTQVGFWQGHKSSFTVKVSSKILSRYFEQFGKDCYSKYIPDYIFLMPQEIKDELLKGLLRGDGSLEASNIGNYYTISYATVSKRLIEGIDLLLREKGILASRRIFRSKKSKENCYELRISESKEIKKLLPFLTEEKRKNIKLTAKFIKSPVYERLNESVALLPIKEIKRFTQPTWVYALETQNSFYLTTGGLLTHNCLPKDTKALIRFAEKLGVDLKLHKVVDEINDKLLKEQGIFDPEKYSKRE